MLFYSLPLVLHKFQFTVFSVLYVHWIFIAIFLSAVFLAAAWPGSAFPTRSSRQVKPHLPLPTRTSEERRKSPLFPKMQANFMVKQRAAPAQTSEGVKSRRTSSMLLSLNLKQKIGGQKNEKRMTVAAAAGVTHRPMVRPAHLKRLGVPAAAPGLATRAPLSPKRPLMKTPGQLMETLGRKGALVRQKRSEVTSGPTSGRAGDVPDEMPEGLGHRDYVTKPTESP